MIKKEIVLISIIFIIGSLISAPAFVFGQDEGTMPSDQTVDQSVDQLNSQIQDKKNKIQTLHNQQSTYQNAIREKQSEKASLNSQLAILDNRIAGAQLEIELVSTDIETVKLEIEKNQLDIKNENEKINQTKRQIADILNLLYKDDNIGTLEIMLNNSSLADFLSQAKYLEDINDSVKTSLDNLEMIRRQLERDNQALAKKNIELMKNQADLQEKQANLEFEKNTKTIIIGQVGDSERQYTRLLAEAKAQEDAAEAEMSSIERAVRAKLSKQGAAELDQSENGLVWPVAKNTITAYFHDPDYPFRKIFEHPGVDVRTPFGASVKAAASGFVARVKFDGSTNYAYIMLVHGNGLATVYGHVSGVFVHEDEYVTQGQAIGLSGGIPGSPGSGPFTTGAHLHFEVRFNGIPVDPLGYLP